MWKIHHHSVSCTSFLTMLRIDFLALANLFSREELSGLSERLWFVLVKAVCKISFIFGFRKTIITK